MKAFLMERRLWGYIDGTKRLKDDPTEKEDEDHQHKLNYAYSKLIMSLSTACVALCQADETGAEVWKTLTKQFDKNSNLAKLRL